MNYKKLIEGEKTEMPISSQVTLNDKNWKILKKFRETIEKKNIYGII